MHCVAEPRRWLNVLRFALMASFSMTAVACSSDINRFEGEPFSSGAPTPSQEVTGSVPQRSSSVQSTPLPPPSASYASGSATRPTGVTGSTAAVAPKPAMPVGGPAAASASHVHIIAPGETLMKLSRQYNKPLIEIARANHIPPSTLVKIGDRIVIPGVRATQSPQQLASRQPMASSAPPLVPPGKPAPQIAQPRLSVPATQKVVSTPAAASPTANVVTPAAQNPEPPKVKQDATAAVPSFRWPVNGRIIQAFGPKPTGQQNDGINVSVPEGTAIKAAEDGVVAYAGNELKTYGNLVLIRHANGYVTAYAHASEIMVKRDDTVKRGQVIAKSGQTGSVTAPQVHFEIRKGSTPIDPGPFLAKAGNG
jgi:murein DD-endopeptidase MepM/ murein hydrolase activator NlpD